MLGLVSSYILMVEVHKRLQQKNARGNENTARGNHKKSTNLKKLFCVKAKLS